MVSVVAETVPDGAPPVAAPRRVAHAGLVAGLAVAVLVIDQITKEWALERLGDGSRFEIAGWLWLELTWNTGTAFSLGSGWNLGPVIAVLGLGVVAWLLWSGYTTTVTGAVAAGLVAGGAVGNLADRAFRTGPFGADVGFMGGAVVDFVATSFWPTFNVADACIVVGALLLLVTSLRAPKPEQ